MVGCSACQSETLLNVSEGGQELEQVFEKVSAMPVDVHLKSMYYLGKNNVI